MIGSGWRWTGAVLAASLGLIFAVRHYQSWRAVDVARQALYVGDPEDLIAMVGPLYEARPADAELTYMLAVAHRRAAKMVRAGELLQTAQELGWPAKQIQRQQYLIRLQLGEIQETEEYLLALTALGYPDDEATEIYECVARAYLGNMQVPEVNAVLWHWLQWQPDAIQPRMIKAELLDALHDFRGKIREYEDLLRIEPENFQARVRLGRALLDVNELAAAREQFEAAYKLRPDNHSVALGLAVCYRRTGELDKAASLFERALEGELSSGEQAMALFELGQLALGQKNSERATECFERAIQLAPSSPRLNYAYGVALTRIGKKAEGQGYLEKSKELEQIGQRFSELMDEILRQPGNADLRCEVGRLALGAKNRAEAYRWLSSALRCDPHHSPSHKALADYYAEGGRQDLAEQYLAMVEDEEVSTATSAVKD
jgi:Tfp pilus assembly protein PilF